MRYKKTHTHNKKQDLKTLYIDDDSEGHQPGRHGRLGGMLLLGGHRLHKEQGGRAAARTPWSSEVRCCQEDVCQRRGIHTQQGRKCPNEDAMVVWEHTLESASCQSSSGWSQAIDHLCISDLAMKIKDRPACTPSFATTKCLATHFCMFLASGGFIPSSVMPPTYAALGLGHNGRIYTLNSGSSQQGILH
ncbi:hypothetical protein QYE76_021384 [Lolium multiflorum]|uniref:Uncharacterized protein n=1 Tax=Lolium multiflorum TaxID=4521 RepID=A0AAD8R8W5_LOLMU|nr:hypothetical protein QYE76_021384 [Lolium multiflorum]